MSDPLKELPAGVYMVIMHPADLAWLYVQIASAGIVSPFGMMLKEEPMLPRGYALAVYPSPSGWGNALVVIKFIPDEQGAHANPA